MRSRLMITAYDVVHPGRLTRARHVVTAYAHGGQKSVLECWLATNGATRIFGEMAAVVVVENDKLGVFRISRARQAFVLGRALAPDDPPVFIIS